MDVSQELQKLETEHKLALSEINNKYAILHGQGMDVSRERENKVTELNESYAKKRADIQARSTSKAVETKVSQPVKRSIANNLIPIWNPNATQFEKDAALAKAIQLRDLQQQAEEERKNMELIRQLQAMEIAPVVHAAAPVVCAVAGSNVNYYANSVMFKCPHCGLSVEVLSSEFNCRIFRCGQYFEGENMIQFPQHASEQEIRNIMARSNGYIGCGKPFSLAGDFASKNVVVSPADWSS